MPQGTEADSLYVSLGLDDTSFERGIEQFNRTLDGLQQTARRVGAGLTASVTAPIGLAAGAALRSAARFEKLKLGLESIIGSSSAASAEFEKLREAAQFPGLTLEGALQGSVRLQAVGFSADEARRALSEFGNALAIAGGSAQDLAGVSTALSQIVSKGTISAEEVNQIAERVPQIRTAIEDAFGTADTEAIQDLGIEAEEFVNRVVDEFAKLPRATSGLANSFTNLQQQGTIALATLGDELNEAFDVTGLVNSLTASIAQAVSAFTALDETTQQLIFTVSAIAAATGPVLLALGSIGPIVSAVSSGFSILAGAAATAWAAITSPIGLVVAAIGAVAGAVYLVVEAGEDLQEGLADVFLGIGDIAIAAGKLLANGFKLAFQNVQRFALDAFSTVIGYVADLAESVGAGGIADTLNSFSEDVGQIVSDEAIETTRSNIARLGKELEDGFARAQGGASQAVSSIKEELLSLLDVDLSGFLPDVGGAGGVGGGGASGGRGGGGTGRVSAPSIGGEGSSGETIIQTGKTVQQTISKIGETLPGVNARLRELAITSSTAFKLGKESFFQFADGLGFIISDLKVLGGELSTIPDAFTAIGDVAKRVLQNLVSQLASAAAKAAALAAVVALIPGVGQIGGISSFGGFFKQAIPFLAEGGIVTKPTLAVVGEGGQSEAVVPLSKANRFGFGGGAEQMKTALSGINWRISGQDIVASYDETARRNTRRGV